MTTDAETKNLAQAINEYLAWQQRQAECAEQRRQERCIKRKQKQQIEENESRLTTDKDAGL